MCNHYRKDDMNGQVFCVDCGEVLDDFTEFIWDSPSPCSDSDYEDDDHYVIRDSKALQSETPPPPPPPPSSPVSSTPTNPTCLKDLIKIARERGVKYHSRMSKSEFCEVLGVSLVRPNKYMFVNKETGEQRGFTPYTLHQRS